MTRSDPDAYLRRIMVNTHRSWWRARWRRETPAEALPDGLSGDDIADRQALGALVRQALAGLPRQQRAVLRSTKRELRGVTAGEPAMKEHPMNDTEETVRRLFAVATEDVPPGIDLLRGVRVSLAPRVSRARALVAVGAAGIVAAAAAITLSAGPAPSAFAQVMHAAARTATVSYRIRATDQLVRAGGLRSQPWSTADGEFDPVKGIGEQTDNLGAQIRYVGGSMYVFLTDDLRAGYSAGGRPVPAWASWERLPISLRPGAGVTTARLALLGEVPSLLGQVDPQDLLALLQSATRVREVGPASGAGWTGSAYTFTAVTKLTGTLHTTVSTSGTVDVDQQGRVRELDAVESFGQTVRKVEISFGNFGLPVSVSAPPANETFTPPAG
jgi:hypothetical protein